MVVGTWRWSQTIPHPQKPYRSRQNFDSTCNRKKVRISTYELGGHLGFWPIWAISQQFPAWHPTFFGSQGYIESKKTGCINKRTKNATDPLAPGLHHFGLKLAKISKIGILDISNPIRRKFLTFS